MATRTWKKERAADRISGKIKSLPTKDIEIKEFVRDTDLTNLPKNVAYRLHITRFDISAFKKPPNRTHPSHLINSQRPRIPRR